MPIQESGQMYLETIHILQKRDGHVRAIDISEYMGYSKPSVSRAGGLLKRNGYILVDDTVLCVNPKEGMVFRIPMADIRISRVVDLGYISAGDVVLVNFTGSVDTETGNVVADPVSIQAGILWEGQILIEE